ncbi:MAG: DUF922 domain-containing protein [Myxococcota bacterium]
MRRLFLGFALTSCTLNSGGHEPPRVEVEGVGFMDTEDTDAVEGALRVHVDEQRYLLSGRTARDLLVDLSHHRPSDERFTGWTRWRLKWRFEPDVRAGDCRVAAVDVDLSLTTVLPAWEPPVDANPALVTAWDAYIRALEHHESGHSDLAVEAAERIHESLSALPASDSCSALKTLANEVGQAEVRRLRIENGSFDAHTQHGARQGAVFPRPEELAGMP